MVPLQFDPGDQVVVRGDFPIGHFRTPVYVRGCRGVVVRYLGHFENPETLAYCLQTNLFALFKVRFRQQDLWDEYTGSAVDTIDLDLYENWLERG
ncbi:MAG: nitrile hydratase [Gammaproteobacteria bacterium]|nr:nitrile hydratase [Gammaproteobacteria bacterium]|tara:strand:+ start:1020 stop:1304 length:285 start_codon:yes stop_codon:yes gene_type:complete